jgi:hypothetical protein
MCRQLARAASTALQQGDGGCILDVAPNAATSAVATVHPANTPRNISISPDIRLRQVSNPEKPGFTTIGLVRRFPANGWQSRGGIRKTTLRPDRRGRCLTTGSLGSTQAVDKGKGKRVESKTNVILVHEARANGSLAVQTEKEHEDDSQYK